MGVVKFQEEIEFQTETCIQCGIVWAQTASYTRERRRDHRNFYCPNGHAQHYPSETEEERLRKLLGEANAKSTQLAASVHFQQLRAEKSEAEQARLQKRIHAGVCPCCKRTFQNLARHMQTKHPGE